MTTIDAAKLEALAETVTQHAAGAMGVLLAYIGDQLGLYRALAESGPLTSDELADATKTSRRYVREWLSSNAAGGYVEYDAETGRFHQTPEQALVFAREGEPGCMQGFFQSIVSAYIDEPKNTEAFRTDAGIAWGDHNPCCFQGTERFFRPLYEASLIAEWIPALDGVRAKLEAGALVADVGCGRGLSTLLMAKEFPRSEFHGYDFHAPSIEAAREKAREAGLENTRFEVATAKETPKESYDLVAIFDALHDMGDPVGAASRVRDALAPSGTLMVVEPLAGDSLVDNLHPLGQAFYAFSTLICTPASKSQEVGLALGAQAGPKRLTDVLQQAGFGSVRVAAETGSNMVLEARP